jgi:hypothetical protein
LTTSDYEEAQDVIVEDWNKRKILEICKKVAFLTEDKDKTASELATMITD